MSEGKEKRERGEGSIFLRGKTYWIKYYRNGKPYRESAKSEKEADAKKLLRKRQGEIASGDFIGPDAERVTVRELSEDYLNDYRINGKKSLVKARRIVEHHLRPYFGDFKAHSVKTDLVQKYIAKRQGEKGRSGEGTKQCRDQQGTGSLAANVQSRNPSGEDLPKAPYSHAPGG